MPLAGEYEPSPVGFAREQVEQFESSGGAAGNTMQGVVVIVMTTVGVKSGKLRKIPLMRVEHDGRYAAIASNGGSAQHPVWYHNVKAQPLVELQDGAAKQDYTAREVSGDERAEWWTRSVAVWPDYENYQANTDREIPVIVLEPSA